MSENDKRDFSNPARVESRRDIWMGGYWAAVNENIQGESSNEKHEWWKAAYERYQNHDGGSTERPKPRP